MQLGTRNLRSQKRVHPVSSDDIKDDAASSPSGNTTHMSIPMVPQGSKLAGLNSEELRLLRLKQRRLIASAEELLSQHGDLKDAIESTLIFAQYEAGTAVCIHPGWALTCGHCFGDTDEEYLSSDKRKWLLNYRGRAVQVECRVRDSRRDLALLEIIAIEQSEELPEWHFPYIKLSQKTPRYREEIFCIGQPGSEDLESVRKRRTDYNLVEVSYGRFRGMLDGDPQDNTDIGSLKHDAEWTYWGHSGAPLVKINDGSLIGLHSSWDDQTAMRHGVPYAAIEEFLRENEALLTKSRLSNATPAKIGSTTIEDIPEV